MESENNTVPEKTSSSLLKESAKENYFIVFVIPTHPQKVQQRNVIRNTWANVDKWSLLANKEEEKKRIKVLFICGNLTGNDNTAALQLSLNHP